MARNRGRDYWAEKPQRFARIIEIMFLNRGDHLYLWHFQLVRPINSFYLSQFELNILSVVTVVVVAAV